MTLDENYQELKGEIKKRKAYNYAKVYAQSEKYKRWKKEDYLQRPETKAKRRAWEAARLAKDPRLTLFTAAKARAKRINVEFNITIDDILIPEVCPVLDIKLLKGKNVAHDASPSLERMIPERGYVKGNVRVISKRANTLKNDAKASEAFRIYEDLKRIESLC